jgi:hypothetical protein
MKSFADRCSRPSASFAHHSATVARDLWFFLCGDNLNLLFDEVKKLKTVGCSGSNEIAVLSDAAGEELTVKRARDYNPQK